MLLVSYQAKWKIFISYRATQSMFVRQVVDQLISIGCEIWFAEYITFDWRLRQDDTWLKSQISDGTAHSEWGVIFASKDYIASDDCKFELNQLLEQMGTQRILQISLDGTQLERLDKSETFRCASEDVMEAVDFIAKRVGLGMANPARPGRTLAGLSKRIKFGRQFTLDSYGWSRWWRGTLDALVSRYNVDQPRRDSAKWGPFMKRDVHTISGNNIKIFMNLRYGKEQLANYDKWTINFQEIENAKQEKEVFNKLNEYASTFHFSNIESPGVKVKLYGVHLLLKDKSFGHIALTYTYNASKKDCSWTRKTSIHLRDPFAPSSYYEFVFTFLFKGSFNKYCRYTGVMDDLALSVDTV